jgi:hypothetical protein
VVVAVVALTGPLTQVPTDPAVQVVVALEMEVVVERRLPVPQILVVAVALARDFQVLEPPDLVVPVS